MLWPSSRTRPKPNQYIHICIKHRNATRRRGKKTFYKGLHIGPFCCCCCWCCCTTYNAHVFRLFVSLISSDLCTFSYDPLYSDHVAIAQFTKNQIYFTANMIHTWPIAPFPPPPRTPANRCPPQPPIRISHPNFDSIGCLILWVPETFMHMIRVLTR